MQMYRVATCALALALLAGCPPGGDVNTDGDCLDDAEEEELGTDPESVDSDGDGLEDCVEIELGTDPVSADSDGDGSDDAEEIECVSDPLDPDEQCYECGWAHGDPGGLESDGNDVGDTVANVDLIDQCGDDVPLWDLAGKYRILFITAAWCGACRSEAAEIPTRTEDLLDEFPEIEFEYAVILFEDYDGTAPEGDDAETYWGQLGEPGYPVLSDPAVDILMASGYGGAPLPGKLLVNPEMEILELRTGHGYPNWAFDFIRNDAGL